MMIGYRQATKEVLHAFFFDNKKFWGMYREAFNRDLNNWIRGKVGKQ